MRTVKRLERVGRAAAGRRGGVSVRARRAARSGLEQEVEDQRVDDEPDDHADGHGEHADDEPVAQLGQVLDQGHVTLVDGDWRAFAMGCARAGGAATRRRARHRWPRRCRSSREPSESARRAIGEPGRRSVEGVGRRAHLRASVADRAGRRRRCRRPSLVVVRRGPRSASASATAPAAGPARGAGAGPAGVVDLVEGRRTSCWKPGRHPAQLAHDPARPCGPPRAASAGRARSGRAAG